VSAHVLGTTAVFLLALVKPFASREELFSCDYLPDTDTPTALREHLQARRLAESAADTRARIRSAVLTACQARHDQLDGDDPWAPVCRAAKAALGPGEGKIG
jgi:hypothetical protein